jgi:precorrin-2 dehydrogenase/sirohydrochlorin ferrochelatase
MAYYPVFLDISGLNIVVVGGGRVAERKVEPLVKAGALVTIVSPRLTPGLKKLVAKKSVAHRARGFQGRDVKGKKLVFVATGSASTNRQAAAAAVRAGAFVNVADAPKLSNFIVPSVVERGALKIAVSTSGKCPFLAKHLREELEKLYGPEYAVFVEILGGIRNNLLKKKEKSAKKEKIYRALLDSSIPELLRTGSWSEIDRRLSGFLGLKGR